MFFVFSLKPPSGIAGPATEHNARSTDAKYYHHGSSNVSSTLVENKIDNTMMADKTEMANWPNFLEALELADNDDSEFIMVEQPSTVFGANAQLLERFHSEGYKVRAKKPNSSLKMVYGPIIKTE